MNQKFGLHEEDFKQNQVVLSLKYLKIYQLEKLSYSQLFLEMFLIVLISIYMLLMVRKLENSAQFDDLANVIFDQAVIAEGGLPDDPAEYIKRINSLLLQ